MEPKISEIRISHISNMPEKVRRDMIRRATPMGSDFKGFVRVTYVTESPKRIFSIEPIRGSGREAIASQTKKEGITIPVF